MTKSKKEKIESNVKEPAKKKGRPKKQRTPEELAEIETKKTPKLSLAEKQQLKLEAQKKKEAAKAARGESEPKNKERFYCTNKELHQELLKWRNSSKDGITVLKKVNGKLVKTETDDTFEGHEIYNEGTEYFVKLSTIDDTHEEDVYDSKSGEIRKQMVPGPNKKLYDKAKKQLEEFKKRAADKSKYDKFYEEHKSWVLHDITEIVKREGWTFNYDCVEDRNLTDRLGNMMIAIGDKLLNHSSFRNYDPELKLDMRSQFFCKLLRGLKNYNFKFNNPFAFFTTCAWNSFLIILNQHYKHQNIRKDLMEKMAAELQAYTGISPNTGLSRCIKAYLGNDFGGNEE